MICDRCRSTGAYALRDGLTDYLAAVSASDLSQLPEPDEAMSREAIGVTRRFVEYHLERRLASFATLPD